MRKIYGVPGRGGMFRNRHAGRLSGKGVKLGTIEFRGLEAGWDVSEFRHPFLPVFLLSPAPPGEFRPGVSQPGGG